MIKLALLLLLLATTAHADGILHGVVVDNETRQVIEGVSVSVYRCHCGVSPFKSAPNKTVVTDIFGSYEMCLPDGPYVVKADGKGRTVEPEYGMAEIKPCESETVDDYQSSITVSED